eukprot:CAMPEP_0201555874 /NCGR_PEP_ID=MMETSP0173_2-20130828/51859_1 /ASSEMBLY_ACC=CAM_ASM_000268 /TAXON_ID=218659 /ORGANISM="Vexillifera sp., Strain DIVA3 564/2" /LENGTH=243 /DNA_ID=CAMNT_0047967875 /DNA_START=227 /DNA_END=955 /DNA_ORIENTATION=-
MVFSDQQLLFIDEIGNIFHSDESLPYVIAGHQPSFSNDIHNNLSTQWHDLTFHFFSSSGTDLGQRHAHWFFLKARIPQFERGFLKLITDDKMSSSQTLFKVIENSDIGLSLDVFENFLQLLYTGTLEFQDSTLAKRFHLFLKAVKLDRLIRGAKEQDPTLMYQSKTLSEQTYIVPMARDLLAYFNQNQQQKDGFHLMCGTTPIFVDKALLAARSQFFRALLLFDDDAKRRSSVSMSTGDYSQW